MKFFDRESAEEIESGLIDMEDAIILLIAGILFGIAMFMLIEPAQAETFSDVKQAATAKPGAAHKRRLYRRGYDSNGNSVKIIDVDTAGGKVQVSPDFAPKIYGFIADVVARGFKGRIKCYSLAASHVPGSLHFTGNACDFAQRGWNQTVAVMYRVRDLTAKWGLRDGCTFRDCGHIDAGLGKRERANLYAAVQDLHHRIRYLEARR